MALSTAPQTDLTVKDKQVLIQMDPRTRGRVQVLSSELNISPAHTEMIVAQHGIKTVFLAARIARQMNLPLSFGLKLAAEPVLYVAVSSHHKLLAVLQQIDEAPGWKSKEFSISARVAEITAGLVSEPGGRVRARNTKITSRSFTDFFSVAHPTEEDMAVYPELAKLNDMIPLQARSDYLNGALGYTDTSVPVCLEAPASCPLSPGESFLLINNGQDRSALYKLPNRMRSAYQKWYRRVVEMQNLAAKNAGLGAVAICSGDLIRVDVKANNNHDVPQSVIDRHYDRYSEKRGYQRHKVTFQHPVNRATLTGDIWVKQV